MKPEVGQTWKTRGGWCAVITAIIRSKHPVLAVHLAPAEPHTDEDMKHYMNGAVFPNQESPWDLVELTSEAS